MTKATWYKHAVGGAEFVPGLVIGFGACVEGGSLEVGGVDPHEVEFTPNGHGAVFEGFDDGEVGVVQVGVFADESNGDLFGLQETVLGEGEGFPG